MHLSPVYDGHVDPVTLTDEHGNVNVYLLPFLKPAHVRRFFPDAQIESYTDAVRVAVAAMQINTAERNVLVAHQFVTGYGSHQANGETVTVGGSDNVDAAVLADFDYVALGHIHAPDATLGRPIRYCGTPLKYSFSEIHDEKSLTVAELGQKGELCVRTVPLTPLHGMRELRGEFDALLRREGCRDAAFETDYLRILLTDENEVPNAMGRLRAVFRNLLYLDYDNARTRAQAELALPEPETPLSPAELFAQFYEMQNNAPLSAEQAAFVAQLLDEIGEADA